MLYTWNLYNIVHQLHLNKKSVLKKEHKLGLDIVKDILEIYIS